MSGEFDPVAITPPAGMVKGESDRVIEGRWSDMQWMRFVSGRPQKRGGWAKQTTALSTGVLRALHAWRDLESVEYMAGGTYAKLYVYERDFTQHDITPLASEGTLGTDPFETTDGSSLVSVTHASHGRSAGDTVIYDDADPVGGLTIDGSYTVVSVTGAGVYVIDAGADATSDDTGGGGSVTFEYEVTIGTERGAYGLGYGVGRYGIGTYGTPRTGSTVLIEPRVWSLDHFGKILLGSFNGGSIYSWNPDAVPAWGRAEKIADAPDDVRFMFVTEEGFVMALCEGMRVDWSSQRDYETWIPAEDNTANTRTLAEGTKLIAGKPLANHITLIWSDFALYVFQYTGSSSIFSSRLGGRNCGLISPSAAVTANGIAYWMGHTTFYLYNGAVQKIPNVDDIRDYVFKNLRSEYGYLCWGMHVDEFDEVIFFYVPIGGSEPGFYVSVNIKDYSWAAGQMERSAGTFFTHGDTRPYIAKSDGHIYLHEEGYNADGEAIEAFITLAPTSLQSGKANLNIDGMNIDLHDQVGDVEVTLEAWDRLRHPTIDSQTKTVTEDDDLVDFRVCGRYAGMTIRSNAVDGYFRFGKPDVLISSNGTRR